MIEAYIGMIVLWPLDWAPVGWALCNGAILPISQNNALFALLGTTYGGNGVSTFALPDLRGRVPLGVSPGGQGFPFIGLGQQNGVATIPATVQGGVTLTGSAAVTLTAANLPAHNHTASFVPPSTLSANVAIPVDGTNSTDSVPTNATILAKGTTGANAVKVYSSKENSTTLKPFNAPVVNSDSAPIPVTVDNTGSGTTLTVPFSVPMGNLPVKSAGQDIAPYQPGLGLNFIICVNGVFPTRP